MAWPPRSWQGGLPRRLAPAQRGVGSEVDSVESKPIFSMLFEDLESLVRYAMLEGDLRAAPPRRS